MHTNPQSHVYLFISFKLPHTNTRADKCMLGRTLWIHYYSENLAERQAMVHTEWGVGLGGAVDVIYLSCSFMHLPHEMDRDSSTCQCATETLKWKILLVVPLGELLAQLVYSASSSSTHVHAHVSSPPTISPSSLHPFSCNYAPWLFLSVFFQKLPGETRVEKPIACSQQIKEARAFLVTSLISSAGRGRIRFRVQKWVRDEAPCISILLSLLHSKCPHNMKKESCVWKDHLAEGHVILTVAFISYF